MKNLRQITVCGVVGVIVMLGLVLFAGEASAVLKHNADVLTQNMQQISMKN